MKLSKTVKQILILGILMLVGALIGQPTAQGYLHAADVFILLAAILLPTPHAMAAAGMSGNNRPFIVKSYGFDPIASGDTAIDGEISKALTTAHGRNGAGVLTVKKKTSAVVPINSMVIGKDGGNGDRQTFGIGNDGDPSPTLQAAHHHAVAITRRVV